MIINQPITNIYIYGTKNYYYKVTKIRIINI